jgi:hypothetical protein
VVQGVFSVVGDVEVGKAIIVVIAYGHTHAVIAVTCVRETGFPGDVGEASIRILPVKTIPIPGILPVKGLGWVHRIGEPAAIDKKNVEQSVIVVIEQRHTTAHGLNQVLLRSRRVHMAKIQATRMLHVKQRHGRRQRQG